MNKRRRMFPTPHVVATGLGSVMLVTGLLISSVTVTLSGVVLLATVVYAVWELGYKE